MHASAVAMVQLRLSGAGGQAHKSYSCEDTECKQMRRLLIITSCAPWRPPTLTKHLINIKLDLTALLLLREDTQIPRNLVWVRRLSSLSSVDSPLPSLSLSDRRLIAKSLLDVPFLAVLLHDRRFCAHSVSTRKGPESIDVVSKPWMIWLHMRKPTHKVHESRSQCHQEQKGKVGGTIYQAIDRRNRSNLFLLLETPERTDV